MTKMAANRDRKKRLKYRKKSADIGQKNRRKQVKNFKKSTKPVENGENRQKLRKEVSIIIFF